MTPFDEIPCGKSFDHVDDKCGDKAKDQKGMAKPAIDRLAKEFLVKDDIPDENFDIPPRPTPELLPAPIEKYIQLVPRSRILGPF